MEIYEELGLIQVEPEEIKETDKPDNGLSDCVWLLVLAPIIFSEDK